MNNSAFAPDAATWSTSSPHSNAHDLTKKMVALWQSGQYAACFEVAQQLVQAFPKTGLAWKLLGELYPRFGQAEQALPALLNAQKCLPKDAEVAFNLGNAYAKAKDYPQAEQAYQKAIKLSPTFSQAYENLGSVRHLQNNLAGAQKALVQAVAYAPTSALAQAELGLVLHKQGKAKQAMQYYRQALQLNPSDATTHYNLAQALEDVDDISAAQACYEAALVIQPDYIDALFNLGYLHKRQQSFDEANRYFSRILTLDSEHERALQVLADSYLEKGEIHLFIDTYLKAVGEGNAFSPEKLSDMVAMLLEKDLPNEAEKYCQLALEKAPDSILVLNNMGLICYARNDPFAAIEHFEKAIALQPDFAPAYSNGALPLLRVGKLNEAIAYLHKAIELSPKYFAAYVNLGMAYSDFGNIPKALECLEKALEIKPDHLKPMQSMLFLSAYHTDRINARYFKLLKQFGEATAALAKPFQHWRIHRQDQRLKIGFVSGDLKHHPVGLFLKPLLSHLDPTKFDVFIYSNSVLEDKVTGDLKSLVSGWRTITHLNDEMAARKIHEDGIHILIDLSGHTSLNRVPMFAWKPAPLQMTWLGYWASTGLPAIDYLIADEVSVPPSAHHQFSEKVAYLPDTRMCFSQPMYDIEVSTLPALLQGYVTLGCYHKYTKATDEVVAMWCEVLQQLPTAQLRWQTTAFRDPKVVEAAQARFASHGIAAERCRFLPAASVEVYLQSHAEVDFILDTFPFTGGTTTCDALWMGVPTLTIAGDYLIARQGASLMTAAGLSDWVVNSPADFVATAVTKAQDLVALSELRATLRPQLAESALFNGQRFTDAFAELLQSKWRTHNAALSSEHFTAHAPVNTVHEVKTPLWVVSATTLPEQAFWQQTALGISLRRHMQKDDRIQAYIAFECERERSLAEVYDAAIAQATPEAMLMLTQENVWLDEYDLYEVAQQAIQHYAICGVAGNRQCLPNQPSWQFADIQLNEVDPVHLLGGMGQSPHAFGKMQRYGEAQGEAKLLASALLLTRPAVLENAGITFDHDMVFDMVGMDFCRTATQAGLSLGIWPLAITQQPSTVEGSAVWYQAVQRYVRKWDDPHAVVNPVLSAELRQAMEEVYNLALQVHEQGDLAQAAQLYQEILNTDATHALAMHNLALIEWQPDASSEVLSIALARFEQAYQLAPAQWQFLSSYVTALAQCGLSTEAAQLLAQAQGHDAQQLADLATSLGLVLPVSQPTTDESLIQKDVVSQPSLEVQQALLQAMETQQYDHLEKQLESLLAQYPAWIDGWKMLTDCLMVQKRDARYPAQQALALNAKDAREHCYYGLVLKAAGDDVGAAHAFEKATILDPGYVAAWNNWGLVLKDIGQPEAAVSKFEQALQLQPEYADCFSNLLFCLSHVDGVSSAELLDLHVAFAERYEAPLKVEWPQHTNTREAERVLKVGFVSADLRAHSIAHFLLPVVPLLAQQPAIQLYAYAGHAQKDTVTDKLQSSFAVWREVSQLSDADLAAQIVQDQIDILIDLSGHTAGNRLRTFARKPAPVQVSWLGYLHSTGLSCMDYYLADSVLAPAGTMDSQFTEQLVQLPVFGTFEPHAELPEVNALPALSNGYLTFGCFNRPNKITEATLQLWASLLKALPDSRLFLGGMHNATSSQHILNSLHAAGVSAERITLAYQCEVTEYLQRHHMVDVCLDTQPSSGVTTTAHALWMGVPTLCLAGDSVRSRGAAALMSHAGLDEWVATESDQWLTQALQLVSDLPALAALRIGLRSKLLQSPLSQPQHVADALVEAWKTMWQSWCAQAPAKSFQLSTIPTTQAMFESDAFSAGATMSISPAPIDETQVTPLREQDPVNILVEEALTLMQQGDNTEAAQLFQEILKVYPEHGEANYQLGFIETHTISAQKALPRFEKAVSSNPWSEQYWVGFIDALVMAHETMIALRAIEEGQKYGLSEATANLLQTEILNVLQQKNESLIDAGYTIKQTKFVIVAPHYTDKSAGIVVLHELCDEMNKRGYQTAIHFFGPGYYTLSHQPHHYGPDLRWYAVKDEAEMQVFINEGVVIYPEIVHGNPLNAPRVVRYVLNNEGFVVGNKMDASDQDFILAFSSVYHENPHAVLTKQCHRTVFNKDDALPTELRKMDLTYIGKGSKYGYSEIMPGSVELTRDWPKNREELAILFKNTRYLYTWDFHTQTVTDAMLCGVIPVFLSLAPYQSFDELHSDEAAYKLRTSARVENGEVILDIPDDYKERINQVLNDYYDSLKVFDRCIDNVLLQIERHFALI